jgi:hypothetical protein
MTYRGDEKAAKATTKHLGWCRRVTPSRLSVCQRRGSPGIARSDVRIGRRVLGGSTKTCSRGRGVYCVGPFLPSPPVCQLAGDELQMPGYWRDLSDKGPSTWILRKQGSQQMRQLAPDRAAKHPSLPVGCDPLGREVRGGGRRGQQPSCCQCHRQAETLRALYPERFVSGLLLVRSTKSAPAAAPSPSLRSISRAQS